MLPFLRKPTLCVDIGNFSVKVLELRRAGNTPQVVEAAALPLADSDSDNPTDSAVQALMEYIKERKLRGARVFMSLPVDRVWTLSVPERGVLEDRTVQSMLKNNPLTRVFPEIDLEHPYAVDWQVLDQDRAEKMTEVIYVAAAQELVQQYRHIPELLKQTPVLLDVSSFCLQRLVPAEGAHLVLHVGHRGTDVVAVLDGRIVHSDRINFGGADLLGVILRVTGTKRAHAQTLMETYGFFHENQRLRDELVQYARTNLVQYVAELSVHLSHQAHTNDFRFDKIWVSGGAGRFMGLIPCLQSLLEMPAAMLDPFRELRVAPALAENPSFAAQMPLFAICAGLALREGE